MFLTELESAVLENDLVSDNFDITLLLTFAGSISAHPFWARWGTPTIMKEKQDWEQI